MQTQPNPDYLDQLIDEKAAADYLCYSIRALQNWRVRGGGPLFIKVSGRSVRYTRRDLQNGLLKSGLPIPAPPLPDIRVLPAQSWQR